MLNKPDLIIADEPTTALDVTIQGQVIYEMKLCKNTDTALLWITHDLAVVAGIANRICVMYAGRVVEQVQLKDNFKARTSIHQRTSRERAPSKSTEHSPYSR